MSDLAGGAAPAELQFDSVVRGSGEANVAKPSAACAACHRQIDDEYYDVNGVTACAACRVAVLSLAETPTGLGPLIKAGVFGLGAAIVGAIIYYALIALANIEIGIVAILIGYMVGLAIKKATGNRGGRRFQILAVVLVYLSIAMAYTPVVFKGAAEARAKQKQAAGNATPGQTADVSPRDDAGNVGSGTVALAFVMLFGLIAALPVMVVFGSMPSGLISGVIIFFGMQRAWAMTGAPSIKVSGPYRVGGTLTSASA
jgi:hypothetical protein